MEINKDGQIAGDGQLQLDKPVLLCLGGLQAHNYAEAQNFAANAGKLVGDPLRDHIRVYTVGYTEAFKDTETLVSDYITRGAGSVSVSIARNHVDQLFDRHFRPGLPDVHGCTSEARSERLRQAEEKLGNINFYAYSIGTVMLRDIHRKMKTLLEEKGFNREETQVLMQRVKAVTVGEVAHWIYPPEPWHFTSVHVASSNDHIVKRLTQEQLPGGAIKCITPPDMERMLVLYADIPTEGFRLNLSSRGELRVKSYNDESGHLVHTHLGPRISENSNAIMIRNMVQSALRNAVRGSVDNITFETPQALLAPALKDRTMSDGEDDYLGNVLGYKYAERLETFLNNGHLSASGGKRSV